MFTIVMPLFAASPERGCTKPACPSGIAIARPVPTVARSPGASTTRSHAARSSPASPSTRARDDRVVAQAANRQLDHAPPVARSCSESATRYAANRRTSRRGSRATTSTPSVVSSRCSIGAPSA